MKLVMLSLTVLMIPVLLLSQSEWGNDVWITGSPDPLSCFDSDYVMDGTMYVVEQVNDGTFNLYYSSDHGYTWHSPTSFTVGGQVFPEVRLLAGEPNQNLLFVFMVDNSRNLICLTFDRISLTLLNQYTVASNLYSQSCFDVTRTLGSSYELWTIYWNADTSFRISKSTNYGASWSVECSASSDGFDENVSICYGPTVGTYGNIYATIADCYWSENPDSQEIWLFYEHNNIWDDERLTHDDEKDYDPHIVMSNDVANPAIWIVYTHDFQNSGDLDLKCVSVRGPDSINNPWHEDYISGSSSLDEYWGDVKFYKDDGNPYVNLVYIVDDPGGWNTVRWRYSHGGSYLNWSSSIDINDHDAHTWPYGCAPRIVYSPGATGSGGGVVYAGLGLNDLFCDFPWLTGVEELTDPATVECSQFLSSSMAGDNHPLSYVIVNSGLVEIRTYDLSGRMLSSYGPVYQYSGQYQYQLESVLKGIYFINLYVNGRKEDQLKYIVAE